MPKKLRLCRYHANDLGWDSCTDDFEGCQVIEARAAAQRRDEAYDRRMASQSEKGKTMRQTFRLRLEEIEGPAHNLTGCDGSKYYWTAAGERPDLLEGATYDVTATVAGSKVHNEKLWIKLTRATFKPYVSVADYFEQVLGVPPFDETLADLPVDSLCGRDCAQAIDAARLFLECARKADSDLANSMLFLANETVNVFWRG